ncbi:hypothetical protein JNJ66_04285 [Candidatus Saccharibacteria bacterium]|nr:hypothetical protein [Candidatus Saccharibacteria bacterium]
MKKLTAKTEISKKILVPVIVLLAMALVVIIFSVIVNETYGEQGGLADAGDASLPSSRTICSDDETMRLCAVIPQTVSLYKDAADPTVIRSAANIKTTVTNLTDRPQTFQFSSTCTGPQPRMNDIAASTMCGMALTDDSYAPNESKVADIALDRQFLGADVLKPSGNVLSFEWKGLTVSRPVKVTSR